MQLIIKHHYSQIIECKIKSYAKNITSRILNKH